MDTNVPDLTSAQRQAIGEALVALMEAQSEDRWCAGWLSGLEFTLWREVLEGRQPQLAALADLADGWWVPSDAAPWRTFVALAEWRELYARHVSGGAGPYDSSHQAVLLAHRAHRGSIEACAGCAVLDVLDAEIEHAHAERERAQSLARRLWWMRIEAGRSAREGKAYDVLAATKLALDQYHGLVDPDVAAPLAPTEPAGADVPPLPIVPTSERGPIPEKGTEPHDPATALDAAYVRASAAEVRAEAAEEAHQREMREHTTTMLTVRSLREALERLVESIVTEHASHSTDAPIRECPRAICDRAATARALLSSSREGISPAEEDAPRKEDRPMTVERGSECLLVGSHVHPYRCACGCDCCQGRGRCRAGADEHDLDPEHSVVSCPDSRDIVYATRDPNGGGAMRHEA